MADVVNQNLLSRAKSVNPVIENILSRATHTLVIQNLLSRAKSNNLIIENILSRAVSYDEDFLNNDLLQFEV